MTTSLQPRDTSLDALPTEAAPLLGIAVAAACYQQQRGVACFILRYENDELRRLAKHIAPVDFDTVWARACAALEAGRNSPRPVPD